MSDCVKFADTAVSSRRSEPSRHWMPLSKERLKALESPGKTGRILAMEGIRGYAVLLVFMVHQHTLFSRYLAPQSSIARLSQFSHHIGNSGVDLFFVLSGFLIYG